MMKISTSVATKHKMSKTILGKMPNSLFLVSFSGKPIWESLNNQRETYGKPQQISGNRFSNHLIISGKPMVSQNTFGSTLYLSRSPNGISTT
ncbi:hypothetical protein LV89_04735 [Arcicella aurantiaca]|uniref:Uncharacterized protein n=1 Tax=Arcicella aurantiaca TaxID=591202 RepID=A0A316DEV0_9BACT|nr:hypothetical protein [Arcicella aurantiaca]PWK16777.1 hypothetical protein LV89_04735 [Arcicella aurantiaca]